MEFSTCHSSLTFSHNLYPCENKPVNMANDVSHLQADDLNEDVYIQQLLDEAHARLQSSSSSAEKSLTLNAELDNPSHHTPK